jgi:intermediate peptidase
MAIMLQREFERDGIHLPASEQEKVMELRNRITRLETLFVQVASGVGDPRDESGESVGRDGTVPDTVLVPRRQLTGLPSFVRSQLPNGNESNTSEALVRVPVASHNGGDQVAEMVLSMCQSRDAREAVFVARNHEGRAQNATSLAVLQELLDARHDLATVLGFASYGDMQVREGDRMLGSRTNVTAFLDAVRDRLRPEVEREAALMRRELGQMEQKEEEDEEERKDVEDPVRLQQWDMLYCSSRARKRLQEEQLQSLVASSSSSSSSSSFASIESEAKEYFTVDGVINGLDLVCQHLFGLSLEQVPSEEWVGSAEDWVDSATHAIGGARKIVCTHETEGPMGTVYMDLYPREGKYNHAAHFMSRCGHRLPGGGGGGGDSGVGDGGDNSNSKDDGFQLPSLGLLMNFTPPKPSGLGARLFGGSRPSSGGLMSHSEVETLFHEFGHALHSIFSRARYQHLSGTRTLMDFVEVPSHVMEHFVWDHRVLSRFALHHETGEPIPKSLVDRMLQQRSVFWGLETDTQLVYACLDHALHGSAMLQGDPRPSTTEMLHRVQQDCSLLPPHADVALHSRFTHLTGYGAGYYSYLYAKIVAEHVWSRCFKEDPLSRDAGERYRQELLRHGGAKDPNEILKDLLGDAPSMEALVETYFDGRKRR